MAALLRANKIAAGLCYQRLTIKDSPPFCLHGLYAVYLEHFGWYRVDARGNQEGIAAEFCPPVEKLAFPMVTQGDSDLPEILTEPLSVIIEVLKYSKTYQDIANNLPDIGLVKANRAMFLDSLTDTA
ncbi:hypothetical protein NTGM5_290026 [Candidatus Nitrotoga sp. M5]|nr:hypothetical protein NTGM5_290026 [Candidatus Nitrotoga sp. M5]